MLGWIIGRSLLLIIKESIYIKFTLETCAANVKLRLAYCRAERACHFWTANAFALNFYDFSLNAQVLRDLVRDQIFEWAKWAFNLDKMWCLMPFKKNIFRKTIMKSSVSRGIA